MITLYQFPTAFGLPNLSSFCMKLEAFLKLSKIPYEVEDIKNPTTAPKGKAPYIDMEGETIGDSTLIMNMLKEKYQLTLGRSLTTEQHAISHSFQGLLEERSYWIMVYCRWADERNWQIIKPLFFGSIPWIIRNFIANSARKHALRTLYGQGTSRHNPDEIYAFLRDDLKSVADYLGEKNYFFGDEINEIDLCIYALVGNIKVEEFHGQPKEIIRDFPTLLAHYERVKEALES